MRESNITALIKNLKLDIISYTRETSMKEFCESYYASHFRIIYYNNVTPILEVGDEIYQCKAGSIFIIAPNTGYKVKWENKDVCDYYIFEFDILPSDKVGYMTHMLTLNGHVVYQESFIDFQPMFEKLFEEMNNKAIGYESILYSGLLRIVIHIIRAQQKDLALEFGKRKHYPQYSEIIYNAMSYVHTHIDEPIKIEIMCKAIGVSSNQLYKVFMTTFEKSPSQYILRVKAHEAEKLLKKHTYTIEEIARQLGFSLAYHFSKTFKEIKGISPKRYELETRNIKNI